MTGQSIVEEYLALDRETEADLLAMQVGDFYEFFADGAETVADELDLKVSKKSSHGAEYPMAGVPVDDLTPYLRQLVERGYRVAVADQRDEDGDHSREITRVVTPGTLLETADESARYLAAVVEGEDAVGLAFADVTTGRFHVTGVEDLDAALSELYRFDPAEVLPGPSLRDGEFAARVRDRSDAAVALHDAAAFAPGAARHVLDEQFGANAVESVGLETRAAVQAAGAALDYVAETGGVVGAFSRLRPYGAGDHVALDATTQRNLELVEPMGEGGQSLFETLDHTDTSAGGRRLKAWLRRPRRSLAELERRQGAVAALADAALAREGLRETLADTYDLERLASRAVHGSADARDLGRVRETLAALPNLIEVATEASALADSPVADLLSRPDRERAADLRGELDAALVEDPPGTMTEGGLFERGYDPALDELIDRYEAASEWLDGLAAREKERTGITHLQVDRNATDGYYIQVGKSEADAVPAEYREIKTLKNSRRFVTDALEEREREILRIEEERADLERALFEDLRDRVAEAAPLLREVGTALAELDALCSLAIHAVENGWVRPELHEGDGLDVVAGRHPVVEQTTEFVPNDLSLDRDRHFLLVTGPNMSGKSTYMRQAALIVLLAQVGSFVPAREAAVGLVDGIYTRVGALDELAQGRSTFMVEMQELSNILHSASEDSLVILDEVGRGTATYDGLSIAWAATEYLSGAQSVAPSPKVLFATHYHELTALADHVDGVANVHVAVEERDGDVTFLRTVREGPADRSYGIHVAELAGVPDPVVSRARDVLRRLREEKAVDVRSGGRGGDGGGETHQAVFDLESGQFRTAASAGGGGAGDASDAGGSAPPPGEAVADGDRDPARTREPAAESILESLREVDVNETPPVELMAKVQEWQAELSEE